MKLKIILIVLILFLTPSLTIGESNTTVEMLSGFPETATKDNKYISLCVIKTTDDTNLLFNLSIEYNNITMNEWKVYFTLDNRTFDTTETSPGIFTTNDILVEEGKYNTEIIYQPITSLANEIYNFTLNIYSDNNLIDTYKSNTIENIYSYITITPAPTAIITPIPTHVITPIQTEPVPLITSNTIKLDEIKEPYDYKYPLFLITLIVLGSTLIIIIYMGVKLWKKNKL